MSEDNSTTSNVAYAESPAQTIPVDFNPPGATSQSSVTDQAAPDLSQTTPDESTRARVSMEMRDRIELAQKQAEAQKNLFRARLAVHAAAAFPGIADVQVHATKALALVDAIFDQCGLNDNEL